MAMQRSNGPSKRLRELFPDDLRDRILGLCNAHHPNESMQQSNGEEGLGGVAPGKMSDAMLDSAPSPTARGNIAERTANGIPGDGLSCTKLLLGDDEMHLGDDEMHLGDDDMLWEGDEISCEVDEFNV
jgi:hypothetical protein